MLGHIYIKGVIGEPKEDSRGCDVKDIARQLKASQGCDRLLVHIDSIGGSCVVGHAIAEMLNKHGLPYDTITSGSCCSMATLIFVGGQNRTIVKPCFFLVHNPWGQVEGDADQLLAASEIIRQEEDKLINIYHKVTGNTKSALDALMKEDKAITEEEALELGFATQVTDSATIVAVAILPPVKPEKTNTNMFDKKKADEAKGILAQFKNVLVKAGLIEDVEEVEPKGMAVTDSNGTPLELWNSDQSPATEVKTGLMVTSGGVAAEDKSYDLPEQKVTITVTDGVIAEVKPIQASTENDATKENARLKKENEALKAQIAESEKNTADVMKDVSEMKGILAAMKGTHTPPPGKTIFGKEKEEDKEKVKNEVDLKKLRENRQNRNKK